MDYLLVVSARSATHSPSVRRVRTAMTRVCSVTSRNLRGSQEPADMTEVSVPGALSEPGGKSRPLPTI